MTRLEAPTTTDDILNLLRAYLPAAAIGAALELGLFWQLTEGQLPSDQIARALSIPKRRCHIWLELLVGLHLLERCDQTYGLSSTARTQIIEVYSCETWQLLAAEARERDRAGHHLTLHMGYPGSVWEAQGQTTPDYVEQMSGDPELARRYVRMFDETSQALAEQLVQILDLKGARRLLDLGGGSGVVSLALLRAYPDLTAVVVDIDHVCAVGREIADGTPERDRITFHAMDLLNDPLPGGFDVIVECKVGLYEETLLQKVARSLNAGGQFIIVDELVHEQGTPSLDRLIYAFLNSLQDPEFFLPSLQEIWRRLEAAGFRPIAERHLSVGKTVIEAELAES